ncbi:SET and MYND domain-containing protein 4-like [Contarinia nasturtii]|uniref:SET and MYND domain-containing protein 4-like n=1 Tax=Contarinia nasturtii TaxID=265458 RepID=UPI0012D4AACB|nr:SET and MYND domain-containing protein 4-like [Contarinia nasturtii]
MLWKKESSDQNAMYVDLFQSTSRYTEPAETLYILHKMEKMHLNSNGLYYKNDIIANGFRQHGNRTFEKLQFINAIEWYNKSLCFAENGSETIGLAYANRASCFLKLKMFKNCLADIELAKQNDYPAHLFAKLEKRKIQCLSRMENEEDDSEICEPKLDFEINEKFPSLANVLDIQINDEFGRHIVATEDIEIGKTVMVDQCYIGVTKYDHYKSCKICLKQNQNLIPCKKCISSMFCFDCKENDLHEIECNMNFGCPAGYKFMDVVRSISLAKNAFANADELITFVEDMLPSNTLELPSNLVDSRSKYRTFFKLCPDLPTNELYLQQAYLFYQLLLEQKEMQTFFHTTAHKRFLMQLVHHHICVILRGAYNKRTAAIGGVNITDTYINLIAKNLKHSCIPNVCYILKNGFITGITTRPIKKNEQLFISYTILDTFHSEAERRATFKDRNINCKCERCSFKTLPSNLQMISDSNFKFIEKNFKIQTLCNGFYVRPRIELMKEKCFSFLKMYGQMKWSIEMDRITNVLSYLLNE